MSKKDSVMAVYDFEKLKRDFVGMSDEALMKEYTYVSNSILDLMNLYSCGQISWDECMLRVENLDYAKDYISRFFALNYLSDHGYLIDDDLRILPPAKVTA